MLCTQCEPSFSSLINGVIAAFHARSALSWVGGMKPGRQDRSCGPLRARRRRFFRYHLSGRTNPDKNEPKFRMLIFLLAVISSARAFRVCLAGVCTQAVPLGALVERHWLAVLSFKVPDKSGQIRTNVMTTTAWGAIVPFCGQCEGCGRG